MSVFCLVVHYFYTVTFISFHFQPTAQICISCSSLPFLSRLFLSHCFLQCFVSFLLPEFSLSPAAGGTHIISLKWWLLLTLCSHLPPTAASLLAAEIKATKHRSSSYCLLLIYQWCSVPTASQTHLCHFFLTDFWQHFCTVIESPPLSSYDSLILLHQKYLLGFKRAQLLLSVILIILDIVH